MKLEQLSNYEYRVAVILNLTHSEHQLQTAFYIANALLSYLRILSLLLILVTFNKYKLNILIKEFKVFFKIIRLAIEYDRQFRYALNYVS